jgi:hypothetical protein
MTAGGTHESAGEDAAGRPGRGGFTISMPAEQWVLWILGTVAIPLTTNLVSDLPAKWMHFAVVALAYVVLLWVSAGTKFESMARTITRPLVLLVAFVVSSVFFVAVPQIDTAWKVVVNGAIWAVAVVAAIRLEDRSSRMMLVVHYVNGIWLLTGLAVGAVSVIGVLGAAVMLVHGQWFFGVVLLLVSAALPIWWFSTGAGMAISVVLTGAPLALVPLAPLKAHPPISISVAVSALGVLQMLAGWVVFRSMRSRQVKAAPSRLQQRTAEGEANARSHQVSTAGEEDNATNRQDQGEEDGDDGAESGA